MRRESRKSGEGRVLGRKGRESEDRCLERDRKTANELVTIPITRRKAHKYKRHLVCVCTCVCMWGRKREKGRSEEGDKDVREGWNE